MREGRRGRGGMGEEGGRVEEGGGREGAWWDGG